jgi:hypothetical protein
LPEPRRIDCPIIVFAFDRPHYLRRLLEGLRAQQGAAFDPRNLHLVQDGAVSPRSGVRYAEDAAIEASLATFRDLFPEGGVLGPEAGNLGIAGNIRRGERHAFETLGAPLAYFFEDDLEPGPRYLHMLERVREAAAAHPAIGYFAAYGDHRRQVAGPKLHWVGLEHHWGFGLAAAAWRRIDTWLAPYYALLDRADYAARSHLQIYAWQRGLDLAVDKSSQDAMKALACAALGIVRVMPDGCFARYIGERGASFSEARFRELGYDRTLLIEREDCFLAPLRPNRVQALLAESDERHRAFRAERLDRFLAEYAARHFDPDRPLAREDVDALYAALLDRLPESEAVYAPLVGRRSARQLRAALLASREYRGRNPTG